MRASTILSLLLFGASSVAKVNAAALYQLVVYWDEAPDDVLEKIDADSTRLLGRLLTAAPGFQALGAGQTVPGSRRGLELNDGEEILQASSLRGGMDRDLQAGSQCPAACAHSGSAYCRNIGCAYCGSSCSRRLESEILASGARSVEASINTVLDKYCEGKAGCAIRCEILQVLDDGSTSPLA